MKRSSALLTVLLAFAICAKPTHAEPPQPPELQVRVVNTQTDPVIGCMTIPGSCNSEIALIQKRAKIQQNSINYIEIMSSLELQDRILQIKTVSISTTIDADSVVTECSLVTRTEKGEKFLFAIPISQISRDTAPNDKTLSGTISTDVNLNNVGGLEVKIGVRGISPQHGTLEVTLSGSLSNKIDTNP